MSKDVSVIGGSAAGLYAARQLAERGHRVRVFEAEQEIVPSRRSLIVTKKARSYLGASADEATVHTIQNYELFTDDTTTKISLKDPELILERSTLVNRLVSMAEEAGAQILPGRRFLGLQDGNDGPRFKVADMEKTEEESCGALVGADGAFSEVAASAGLPRPSTLPLIQAVVALPQDQSPNTTRVWFLPEETPYFYWLIPHSETQGVLGLIGAEWEQSRRLLERFIQRKSLVASEFQFAEVPRDDGWTPLKRKTGKDGIYLVGDAAGHVKVTTVGGIVTGFKGALGVAETISEGRYSPRLRSLRAELGLHRMIRKALHGFTPEDYSSLLDMMNPSVKRLLAEYTRDEAVRLLLRLVTRQPRLMTLGVRGLLHSSFSAGTGPSGT